MSKKEEAGVRSENITRNRAGGAGQDNKIEAPTVSYLQEFLAELKVQSLLKKNFRGTAGVKTLHNIEKGLDSDDHKVKSDAILELDELLDQREKVKSEIKNKSLEAIVEDPDLAVDERVKTKVATLAKSIDSYFAIVEKGDELNRSQLEAVNEQLELLTVGLEINGGFGDLEMAGSKAEELKQLLNVRNAADTKDGKYLSMLNIYRKEFDLGDDEKEVLQLRGIRKGSKKMQKSSEKLEQYKKHVKEELLQGSLKTLDSLEVDTLLERLEESTYWRANEGDLFGRSGDPHRGRGQHEQLRGILLLVESHYTAALERKIEKLLGAKFGKEEVLAALRERLRASKPRKIGGKSAAYKFADKGEGKFVKALESRVTEIRKSSKPYPSSRGGESQWRSTDQDTTQDAEFSSPEQVESHVRARSTKVNDYLKMMDELSSRVDLNSEEFLDQVTTASGRKKLYQDASRGGKLSNEQLSFYREYLEEMGGSLSNTENFGMGPRLVGVQRELEELQKNAETTGRYAPFLIKLQAYIDRVGLRETSSDFQFAIVLRRAKEIISRLNEDAGGKFDLFQESQFLPAVTSLDEETFYGLSPKVMNQLRSKLELEGPMANWLGMQVEGTNGKRVLSTASFFQILQSREGAMRTIRAPINGADSNILDLWVEHVWGEGAVWVMDPVPEGKPKKIHIEVPNGNRVKKIYNVDVSYFSMDSAAAPDHNNKESMTVTEMLDLSMWMAHYGSKMWWYSGEWEAFAKDFPGDALPQANKRLLSIGAAFRDYGLQYGKFERGYSELAKAGVLLQDFRTFKASDVITANIRHLLYDTKISSEDQKRQKLEIPVAKWDRGEKIGKTIFEALSSRAHISKKYNPLSSLRSTDQIRLMGHLQDFETPGARWEWYRKQQRRIGRKGVPDYSVIQGLQKKGIDNLRGEDEAWAIQAEQINILFNDLRSQRAMLDKLELTNEELFPIMDRQYTLKTGEHLKQSEVSLDRFLQEFDYASVLRYSELRKGSDTIDYQNYSKAKMNAAKKSLDVLNPLNSFQDISELVGIMKGYMPPEQVDAWLEAYRDRELQLGMYQMPWEKYEISMSDAEEWEFREKRGEKLGERPASVAGYNPATFAIRDERGDTWNVTGADGFRVTRKRWRWGNHMKEEYDVPAKTMADVEVGNKYWVGKRWMSKEKSDAILEHSFGIGKTMEAFCKVTGISPESKGIKFATKWGSRVMVILRQHPLFDDPKWAFWSILNEVWEYTKEVQKEMTKELTH